MMVEKYPNNLTFYILKIYLQELTSVSETKTFYFLNVVTGNMLLVSVLKLIDTTQLLKYVCKIQRNETRKKQQENKEATSNAGAARVYRCPLRAINSSPARKKAEI